MIRHSGNLNFSTGQIDIGRYDEQTVASCRQDFFRNGRAAKQWIVKTNSIRSLQPK